MPKYLYTAKTKDSKTVKDFQEAGSQQDLISRLRAKGLYILSVKEIGAKTTQDKPQAFLSRIKRKRASIKLSDLTHLARNLSLTLSSGITLLRSLEIISSNVDSARLEKVLKECGDSIKKGLSLSEAVKKFPNVFNSLWQGIVEVGESSGNLPFVLEKLADYLELRMDFDRKVKSAMVYPVILFFGTLGAILFFFYFILPKFMELFEGFDITLPLPTQIIFAIAKFLTAYPLFIFGGMTGIGISIFFLFKQPQIKTAWDKISLKLPIIGGLTFTASLERFTSTMYILLESGLPLVYTLEVASRSMGNSFLEKNLLAIKEKVRKGVSLSDELKKTEIFPNLISEIAKIGEETGNMPEIFHKISTHYNKDLSANVERFVAALEPMMIIFMGIVIGGIVISLFLPMFKLAGVGE